MTQHRTALVWDDALAAYRFTPDHPLNPRRLQLTVELIRAAGLLDDDTCTITPARMATEDELLAVHDAAFIDAVRRASSPDLATPRAAALQSFGLGSADVPIVPGMHAAAAHICGATLRAAELIADGTCTRAFSIAGGLHHARRAEAAGFCVYNDLAVAIRWLVRTHGMRVMCVDIDAHHGDGTQQIFYDDPDVLTVSFHESGAFLYPGTGFLDETGEGDGYGTSVNIPLDPHTDDVSFSSAVHELVPPLADAFRPDIIVLQAGCDAHVLDPLTHLRCTTSLYADIVKLVGDVADAHSGGRLLATGGGGYAIHSVVPRAWTLVWATLCGIDVPDEIPQQWLDRIRDEVEHATSHDSTTSRDQSTSRDSAMSRDSTTSHDRRALHLPATLRDAPDAFPRSPHSADAEVTNRQTVDAVKRRSLPLLTGWGLAF
jgi:acetoin utilization protein AcuC